MAFQTQCPHCGRILKLKSDAALGRKAPCPKCRTPFVVEPYEEPAAGEWDDAGDDGYSYDYSDEDYGDYGEEYADEYADDGYEDVEPAPSRSSRRSKNSRKKSKKKSAGSPAWLVPLGIGLAALLGLGLLGGGIYFAVAKLGGGVSNAIDLAWLPGDADMYLRVKPDEMWNAPVLASLRDSQMVQDAMAQAGQNGQLNLKPEDIASVTLAGIDLADRIRMRVPLFGGRATGTGEVVRQADPKTIAVLQLKRDLTADELIEASHAEKKTHGGTDYYVSQAGPQQSAFFLADARTLIVGTESEVTKAMDRGSAQERVARIDFINSDHQLVVVFAPQTVLPPDQSPASANPPASQNRTMTVIDRGARAMAFGLTFGQDVDLEVQFDCFDDVVGADIQTEIDALILKARASMERQAGNTPEILQGLMDVVAQTVDSFQVTRQDDQLSVTGRIPGSVSDEIGKLAENPMAALMLPALLQGGGSGIQPPAFGASPPGGVDPAEPAATSQNGQPAGYVPGGPDASAQADIDAVKEERKQVLDQLGKIRGRIKSTTGQLQNAVPGGK